MRSVRRVVPVERIDPSRYRDDEADDEHVGSNERGVTKQQSPTVAGAAAVSDCCLRSSSAFGPILTPSTVDPSHAASAVSAGFPAEAARGQGIHEPRHVHRHQNQASHATA